MIEHSLIEEYYNNFLFRKADKSGLLYYSTFRSISEVCIDLLNCSERLELCQQVASSRIVFLHIPKTAGSSLKTLFNRLTNKIHTTHSQSNPIHFQDACFVTGHFGYAFLNEISCTHSFTILRDPIERIISLYRFARCLNSGWSCENPVHLLNFEEFVLSNDPEIKNQIDSFYVRILTDDLKESFESRADESLPLAIERYRQFTCVGDQAHLDLFLKKMSAALGIPCPPNFPIVNTADVNSLIDPGYEPKPQITPRAQRRLQELTKLDYEVYNTFREREIIEAPSANAKPPPTEPPKPVLTIHNPTPWQRTSEEENPIQIACHWLDETWNMLQFDAQRFPLPAEGIPPQETREVEIQVTPPEKPGHYHLMVTLVQTIDGKEKWLHETGDFTPQIFDREVEE